MSITAGASFFVNNVTFCEKMKYKYEKIKLFVEKSNVFKRAIVMGPGTWDRDMVQGTWDGMFSHAGGSLFVSLDETTLFKPTFILNRSIVLSRSSFFSHIQFELVFVSARLFLLPPE